MEKYSFIFSLDRRDSRNFHFHPSIRTDSISCSVYNCLYFFFLFSFLIFIFPAPNHPHSLHFLLISRLSFLPFLPSLVYYSFFFLPPPFCGVHARQREFTYTQTYSWRLELALRDPRVIYLSQDDRYRLACSR